MSVKTKADEKIELVRENIDSATKAISELVIDRVWGYDDLNEDYQNLLADAMFELMKLRNVI